MFIANALQYSGGQPLPRYQRVLEAFLVSVLYRSDEVVLDRRELVP